MAPGFPAAAFAPTPSAAQESKPTPTPPAYQPHGDFVWEVSGGQSRVYLFGTMHIVMPEYAITPSVSELLAGCDALAVESDLENQELLEAINALAIYSDGTNLYDHLSERGRAHFEWLCEQYGIPPENLLTLKPFSASVVFELLPAQELGFSGTGVDLMLLDEARTAGMPVLELEDGAAVYERFLSLPDDTMERVCILPVPGPDETSEDLLKMYELYINGDADGMLAFLEDDEGEDMGGDGQLIEYEEKDDLYEQYMFDDRNRDMADSIVSWLETPGRDVFATAGLAHYLGEGSVIELIEAEGYTVKRMAIEPGIPGEIAPKKAA